MAKRKIVFIHDLWIHASSWQPWMEFFDRQGYETYNPGWPGDSATVQDCRSNPGQIANRGVAEVVKNYEDIIASMERLPIVIGHSFGGLIAQILLSRGIASAGVAVNPAPLKGVWQLPFSTFKAALPVLGNPFNFKKALSLTYPQFRYAFANAIAEEEARQLYDTWTIPAPCKPLFQAAIASVSGNETKVETDNRERGPLLVTAGESDHIAPPVLGKASIKKYNSSVVSDFKMFDGRGHSLIIDHGWREIADYSLSWLNKNGF